MDSCSCHADDVCSPALYHNSYPVLPFREEYDILEREIDRKKKK